MSYRIDQNTQSGTKSIVIDGWEKGIASSPYTGIANIRNLATAWYPSVAYVNYKRQPATLTGSAIIDAYFSSNYSASFPMYSGSIEYLAQTFHNSIASSFNQVQLYLSKTGSPSGNMTAYLYSASLYGAQYYPYSPPNLTVNTLVVAGGGAGGNGGANSACGGGGGGQVQSNTSFSVAPQAYSIVVGVGGTLGSSSGSTGGTGGVSTFSTITSAGGLGGVYTGGGGGNGGNSGSGKTGGTGHNISDTAGGGGAGDSANGTNGSTSGGTGGNGGVGTVNSISGSSVTYAGGGFGAGQVTNGSAGTGASNAGGGGNGGGDGFGDLGTAGQGGIVIISAPQGQITATGGTHTTSGGNDIWTFTSSGTWTITSPSVNILATSSTVSASSLTGTPTLTSFNFTSTPLTANTYYLIVIKYTGGDSSDTVNVGYGITSQYSGNVSLYSDNGIIWNQTTSPAVSNLIYYVLPIVTSVAMSNPVAKAVSPANLNYILDTNGNVWKQTAVNSSAFSMIQNTGNRLGNGAGGLAYWNNYIIVFGDGMIEFCGNGTGDAGVISSNWNVSGINTGVTVTSSLLSMSSGINPGEPNTFATGPSSGATSATLTTAWAGVSGNYTVKFDNSGPDTKVVTFTNNSTSVSWTGGLGSNALTDFYMYQLTTTINTFSGYNTFASGDIVTFSSSGTLPTGLISGTQYYLLQSVDLTGSTTWYVSSTISGQFIPLTNAGSGTITMTLVSTMVPPIQNTTITGFTWTSATGTVVYGSGATTITLATDWLGANGTFNIVDPLGNNLLGIFVYGSNVVNLITPAIYQYPSSGTFLVQILNPNNAIYKTWNSKVDSNLYFTNGHYIGRIAIGFGSNPTFIPGQLVTYGVNYGTVALLEPQDTAVDMTDLRGQMVIAGNFDTYIWDYVSTTLNAPNPVGEQIYGLTNILNNVYILAGQKGNIYVSNGASAQVLFKIPDYIAGIIDPVWSYGGYMFHRGKLYFQALASYPAGLLNGVVINGWAYPNTGGFITWSTSGYALTISSPVGTNGSIFGISSILANLSTTSGNIDDTNTTFGFSQQPTLILFNEAYYQQTGGAVTWTWNGSQVVTSVPAGYGGTVSAVIATVYPISGTINDTNTSFTVSSSPIAPNILSGIFSLNVSATLVTDIETAGAFIMEAQNSYGLIPVSSSSSIGLLMDNEPSAYGQDSYYSVFSNGNNVGGIDFNDTTLWQNNEPAIETDIIPIGTILEKQTFGRIQFKLDRPMVSGDSISLYWRPSLTDSYQFIGTTANALLSGDFPTSIYQAQWAQFKATFASASSGSSFIPLREMRLEYGNK